MTEVIPMTTLTTCPKCQGSMLILDAEDYLCTRLWCFHCGWDQYIQKNYEGDTVAEQVELSMDVSPPRYHRYQPDADLERKNYQPAIRERTPNTVFDVTVWWTEQPPGRRTRIQFTPEPVVSVPVKFRVSGHDTTRLPHRFFITSIVALDTLPPVLEKAELATLCRGLRPKIEERVTGRLAEFGATKITLAPVQMAI